MIKTTEQGWAVLENDTHISRWVEQTGEIDHGMHLKQEWQGLCPLCGVAVDVGANIGDTTIPMAQLVGPNGAVFAYEPNPEAFKCLVHNIEHAEVGHWTGRYQQAVGAASGNATLKVADNVGASCLGYAPNALKVPMVALDDRELNQLNFLKIDVEGYEMFVLRGAEETIMRCRPNIVIEIANHCNRFGVAKSDILQWLSDHDYVTDQTFTDVNGNAQVDVIAMPILFCD